MSEAARRGQGCRTRPALVAAGLLFSAATAAAAAVLAPTGPAFAQAADGVTDPALTPVVTPARELDLLEVYEVASSLMSYQNPLFIFPGLKAEGFTVNGDGGEFNIVVKGLGLPDSAATLPEPVILHLPGMTRGNELIDLRVEGLPTSSILADGQSLKLINPVFEGTWSLPGRGFQAFDLSLDRASFQGEGISHQLRDLRIRLAEDARTDRVALTFSLKSFEVDYGDSFTGTERVQGFRLSLSGPRGEMAPQTLLKLAYRLSSLALGTSVFHDSLVEDPPPVASLNGLDLRLEIDSDVWEQTVPPAAGKIDRLDARVQILPGDDPRESRLQVEASVSAMEQGLDGMSLSLAKPSALRLSLAGLEARALADLLLDQPALGPVPGEEPFDPPLRMVAEVDLAKLRLGIPQLDFDMAAQSARGSLSSDPVDAGAGQSLLLSAAATDMAVRDWPEDSVLNPFATQVLLPLLPREANLSLAVEGLELDAARGIITALLGLDLRGLFAALPADPGALRFRLADGLFRSRLLEAEWSGELSPRAGRIPLQGRFALETGALTPLQVSMQQSLATPIPAVTQSLSAGVLGLTLLQSFAVREEGGRLSFDIEFPETGGLPLVNGRPLPFQQFIR